MSNRMEFAGNDYADRHPGYRELFRIPHPEHTINLVAPEIVHAPNSVKWLSDAEVGQHMGADFSEVTIDTETKRLQDMIDSEDEYNWMVLSSETHASIRLPNSRRSTIAVPVAWPS